MVGTTLSSRDGSGGGPRDMVVLWKANSAMRGGDGNRGARTLQNRHEVLEAVVIIILLDAFVAAGCFSPAWKYSS